MTATIIAFPMARCRQPATVIEAAERAALAAATGEWEASERNSTSSIETMMRLALVGRDAVAQEAARAWLSRELNIAIAR